jgi:hypothetical protein
MMSAANADNAGAVAEMNACPPLPVRVEFTAVEVEVEIKPPLEL